jgi:dynein heavy chain, axonemal
LKEISKKILDLLAETKEETILDDIKLIETLESSKVKSTVIGEKMSEATQIEEKINISRNEYKNVSIRGAIIYFVIADLGQIDPMYQYSLTYVKNLINEAIKQTTETESDEQRIEALINNITQFVYRNICRGLFEAHKLTFSFLICTSIKRYEKEISQEAWNLLLSGAGLYSKEDQPKNPIPALLKKASWDLVCLLEEAIPQYFLALPEHITKNSKQWKSYAFSKQPENAKLPEDFEKLLPSFERLLILKIFRPEKLLFACTNYVQKELGAEYTVSPSVSMESLFADSDWKTPIIFVLSQGADPTTQLFKFAEENEMEENLKYISLGQGQGSKAEEMIKLAKLRGTWILLQNCHLAKSFMPRLESLILKTAEEEKIIKPSYRLFLTSMPADYFPVSILQNGLKSTTEPPAGIKSNLKRIYGDLSQGRLDTCPGKDEPWRKLLFSLSFFHAVVQERRKFGPLGWNIRYHFNDSDLETSITMLKNFILEQEEIPWDALTYSTGQINYGGRVTDDWDRKLLLMILQTFYTEDVLQSGYKFSQSGVYFSPDLQTVEEYREYIESLPNHENPEIFGMHENASITYQRQESDKMLFTVLQIQPKIQAKSSDGVSSDDLVLQVAADLREKQPMLIEPREVNIISLFMFCLESA